MAGGGQEGSPPWVRCDAGCSPDDLKGQFEGAGIPVVAPDLKGEFLAAEDLGEILSRPTPTTPWAIQDLLAEGDVGIISGPGGSFKTWIGMTLVLSLGLGRDLFEYYRTLNRPGIAGDSIC